MIKLRHLFLVVISAVLIYACGADSGTTTDTFDYAAQSLKDNDSLVKFFKSHYYDDAKKTVLPLVDGKKALSEDPNLKTKEVTESEIVYKLYYYLIDQKPKPQKSYPTVMDSVLVKYEGFRVYKNKMFETSFDANKGFWANLGGGVIRGWTHALVHFKGGDKKIIKDEPISYVNGDEGILFIPSGLAYGNRAQGSIPANSNLIFYVDVWDFIKDTDHDNDGIPSIMEVLEVGDDPRFYDTDEDRVPNFSDADDDNDGVPTKDEDRNGNGNPRDDFSDPNNPNLPDYLNPDIIG